MSGRREVGARRFQDDDQHLFARMSGDFNPMHMDPVAARRTPAGEPVVHGMHAVLWALDILARDAGLGALVSIAVVLNRFIPLNCSVAIRVTQPAGDMLSAEIVSEDIAMISLRLKLGQCDRAAAPDRFLDLPPAEMTSALEEPMDLKGARGWLSPASDAQELTAAFPALAEAIGVERVIGLALLSTLVGMVCPGLHSIFSSFQVDLTDGVLARAGIGFRVSVTDPRFRIVRMEIGGSGIQGKVSALMRMPPARLPSMTALAGTVEPDLFAGHRVLVVGGSRGLGALSARLIASGGGKVIVTYATGAADAAAVATDIRAHRGDAACALLALDVTLGMERQIAAIEGPVTGLLYFATPRIGRQKASVFSPELLKEFLLYYVHGFATLTALLLARAAAARLAVLFPSSVLVAERPENLTEYAMAKAAGEILAVDLAAAEPRLHMVVNRLPRLPTDQNATIVRQETEDPVTTLLPLMIETLLGNDGTRR
jgi:hypothetical protein